MKELVPIYTGNGKGRTTYAFDLTIRISAYEKKVYATQFMKGTPYGENLYLENDKNFEIEEKGCNAGV